MKSFTLLQSLYFFNSLTHRSDQVSKNVQSESLFRFTAGSSFSIRTHSSTPKKIQKIFSHMDQLK